MANHPNRNMPLYRCNGFRDVRAESASEAAAVFANRLAVREFGSRGYMRTCRLDNWTRDGMTHNFEVFIGRDAAGHTSGRNKWLTVHEVESNRAQDSEVK